MGLMRLWLTGVTALLLCLSVHAQTGERVALVVGNSSYPKVPLLNPRNDATGMAGLLRQAGFTVDQQLDTTKDQLSEAVARFGATIKNPNVKFALFFYAGHGLQQDWRNYLVPVSADIQSAADVRNKTVDVSELLAYMDQAKGRSFLVILDACRDDPFAGAYRPPAKGLSQFDAPVGSLLAYSTAPGSVARDGEGENGLYTSYLLKEFSVRGARLEDAFKRVRLNVRLESQGLQIPWESTSLEDDVYLFPSERLKLTDAEQDELFEREMASWMRVRASNDHQLLANFIREYPSGSVSELAQARLKRLLTAQARSKAQPVIVASAATPVVRDTRSDEAARLADQQAQQARARAAELEAERVAANRQEEQRVAAAQAEAARLAQARSEARQQAELEAQRVAAARAAEVEAQRVAAARAAQEAERARAEAARAEAERLAAAREQEQRLAAAQAEAARLAQARADAQKQTELEAQRAVAARAVREAEIAKAEADARRAQAIKLETERVAAAQAEAARAEAARVEAERIAAVREQEQRLAAAQAESARLAQGRAEAQKQAEVDAQRAAARVLKEAELAKAQTEARRAQAAKVEADRVAAAQAEAARRPAASEKVAAAEPRVDTLAATPYFKGYSEHQRDYRTGDFFNYQVIDVFTKAARPLSLQVTAVDVDTDKVEYNNGEYLSDTMGNTIANPRGGFNTPRQFYPAELFVGKKWRTVFKQSRPGGIVYTFRYDMKVVGKETITVPAGTFETFKIEARGFNMQLNARLERNIWVAPGVSGDIAHEIFVRLRNGVIEQNDRQELVSFRQSAPVTASAR